METGSAFWGRHVAAAKLEAISAGEYARRHGLSVSALYYWQRKLGTLAATPQQPSSSSNPASTKQSDKFVALRLTEPPVAPEATTPRITLVLSPTVRLEMPVLPAPSWLAALLQATPLLQGDR